MNKFIFTIAATSLFNIGLNADLPDFTQVWDKIYENKIREADQELDNLWEQYKIDNSGKKWVNSNTHQGIKDLEEWRHFTLIRLYIAYKDRNMTNMTKIDSYINQLYYIDYRTKNPEG